MRFLGDYPVLFVVVTTWLYCITDLKESSWPVPCGKSLKKVCNFIVVIYISFSFSNSRKIIAVNQLIELVVLADVIWDIFYNLLVRIMEFQIDTEVGKLCRGARYYRVWRGYFGGVLQFV